MNKSIAKAYDTIRLYSEDDSYVYEYDIIEVNGKNIKDLNDL